MSGNFCFSLFVGMVMYANEAETKEKYKLPEIKNSLQHIHTLYYSRVKAKSTKEIEKQPAILSDKD